jgi:hypothetical protein
MMRIILLTLCMGLLASCTPFLPERSGYFTLKYNDDVYLFETDVGDSIRTGMDRLGKVLGPGQIGNVDDETRKALTGLMAGGFSNRVENARTWEQAITLVSGGPPPWDTTPFDGTPAGVPPVSSPESGVSESFGD